jgi:hypothetical protein
MDAPRPFPTLMPPYDRRTLCPHAASQRGQDGESEHEFYFLPTRLPPAPMLLLPPPPLHVPLSTLPSIELPIWRFSSTFLLRPGPTAIVVKLHVHHGRRQPQPHAPHMVHQHHRTPHTVHQHHRRMRHLLSGRSRMPSRRAFHTVVRFVRRVRVPPPCVSDTSPLYFAVGIRVPPPTATSDSDSTVSFYHHHRQPPLSRPIRTSASSARAKLSKFFFPFFFWAARRCTVRTVAVVCHRTSRHPRSIDPPAV